jgi:hypothetical protein
MDGTPEPEVVMDVPILFSRSQETKCHFVEHLHSASREDQRGRAAESPKGGAGTLRELIEGG